MPVATANAGTMMTATTTVVLATAGPGPRHPTLEPHLERMKDNGYYRGEYERDGEWLEDEKQKVGEQQNRRA